MSHEDFSFADMEPQMQLAEMDSLAGVKSFAERAKQMADFAERETELHRLFLKVTDTVAEAEPPVTQLSVPISHVTAGRVFDGVNQIKTWRPIVCDLWSNETGSRPVVVLQEYKSTRTDINGKIWQYLPVLSVFDSYEHWRANLDDPDGVMPTIYNERRFVDFMNGFKENLNADDFVEHMSSTKALADFCNDQSEYAEWLQRAAISLGL